MISLLLAAALALPPGAEAVRIGDDAWPQKVTEARSGERVWWWSKECAPQLLRGDAPAVDCAAPILRRVHVIDRESGKKLPGVRVVWGTDAMREDLPDAMLPATITDAEGDASVALPADAEVRMRVDGPRAASWWQPVTAGDAPLRLAAVSAASAAVQLTIGGEPAVRAVVQVELSDIRSWAIAQDGRMLLPALPPVPVLVAAWSDGSAPMAMELDAAQVPRTIDLPRGASVRGRVVDARRRPVEGASIEAVVAIGKLPRGLRRRARSTGDGTFVLHGVPDGPLQLRFQKTGRATVVRGMEGDGDVDAGNITLRAARHIALRVLDSDEQPVAGATVRVTDGPTGTTARDGIARIDGVAAEEDAAVRITAKGFRAEELDVPADAKFPLDVELSRGVRILGTVVRAKSGLPAGPGDVLVNNNGTRRVVPFDASGAIDIGGLEEGKLTLEVRAEGLAPLALETRTVADDETWSLGALRLDEGAVLSGQIVDGDGDPLSGARIRVLRRGGTGAALAAVMNDWIAATSGDDGAFAVSGLASGPHVALFDAAGFAPRVVTLEADAEAVKVALDRARGLSVDCAPVRRCGSEVRLLYAGAAYPWASTSASMQDGRAHLATAAPGAALLRLVEGGQVVHEREVQIGATPETAVQIRLGVATLRGTVASSGRPRRDGGTIELRARTTPAAGVPIYLEHRTPDGQVIGGGWQTDLPSMQSVPVDDAGRFVFAELEPGQFEATYRREGRTARPVTLTVQPGMPDVVLEVPPGELRGRVLREDGTPGTFALVRIVDAAGSQSVVQSDQFGNFETLGLALGRAVVSADGASAAVEVAASRTADVDLVLHPRMVAAGP